jgi:predicted DCC family thiol-disulfide oxidoreductase YuxK
MGWRHSQPGTSVPDRHGRRWGPGKKHTSAADEPGPPLLIYDGDCGFCSAGVRLLERLVRPPADIAAWQHTDLARIGISKTRASREIIWWTPAAPGPGLPSAARAEGGALAISRALSSASGIWPAAGAILRLPPVSWLAAAIYRVTACNRHRLPGGTPSCAAR